MLLNSSGIQSKTIQLFCSVCTKYQLRIRSVIPLCTQNLFIYLFEFMHIILHYMSYLFNSYAAFYSKNNLCYSN